MKQKKFTVYDSREYVERTAEEVPFFPFSYVRMAPRHGSLDSIEEAQYDFVKQAGQPSNPPTPSRQDES